MKKNIRSYPTQMIPTDRHGRPSYGPTTLAEAREQIADGRPREEVADMMQRAGYPGIARRLRKEGQ